jgi:hypothetical protein
VNKPLPLGPIVTRWQKRLRLRDWEISAQWASEAELVTFFAEDDDEDDPQKSAKLACAVTDCSHFDQWDPTALENRSARILLKLGAFDDPAEIERTVVHEMLHILLWPIAPSDKEALRRIFLEQIISTLEPLLVASPK